MSKHDLSKCDIHGCAFGTDGICIRCGFSIKEALGITPKSSWTDINEARKQRSREK